MEATAVSRRWLWTIWELVRMAFREWWEDNTFRLAASLAISFAPYAARGKACSGSS